MDGFAEKIDALFAQNRGVEAEQFMLQTLEETKKRAEQSMTNGEDALARQAMADMVQILNELIGYCRETGQAGRSYEYGDRALAIMGELELQGTVHYATTLLNIANAYRAGGRLEDSLQKYEQVALIYMQHLEPDHMLWANFYNNISLLYQEMKRFDLAKESLLKALEIVMKKPDTIFEQAVTYTNLASTCLELGQEEDAKMYFTGAILLFEKYDIKDSHYCAALSSMGTFYYKRGDYARAKEYFEKSMAGIEASLGKNEYYRRMTENVALCEKALREKEEVSATEEQKENSRRRGKEMMCQAGQAETKVHLPKKGLELCREYYEAYGKSMIEKEFASYREQIAVGLVGEGSDCFGLDDGFSEDHDWGPRFMMWVSREVYEEIGEKLEDAYQTLPKEFQGYVYRESRQGAGRQGVFVIEEFIEKLLGVKVPEDAWEGAVMEGADAPDEPAILCWQDIPMERLAAATNGQVWTDAEGTFTKFRTKLKESYPKRLIFFKMAESAARFSQAGQYNYSRMLKRGDKVSAQMLLWNAVKEALLLLYYAEGRYPLHDKWLLQGLKDVEAYTEILENIESLTSCKEQEVPARLEEIAHQLALVLYRKDFISDVEAYLEEHVGELLFKANACHLSVKELAEEIAKAEFAAFDKVKNYGGRADCQDDWFTFSIMRKSQYHTWNQTMLLQYYYDFNRELAKGHNLIEEKYGRMMESTAPGEFVKISASFPAISDAKRQIIENIVSMQVAWMEDFASKYPHLAGNARSIHTYEDHLYNTSYETYLRGEISTYSDKMLELYGRYVVEYAKNGGNIARDIMEQSVWMYGYESLEEAERLQAKE